MRVVDSEQIKRDGAASFEDKFLDRVALHPNGECWAWQGDFTKQGAPIFRPEGAVTSLSARRYSFTTWVKPVPDNVDVRNLCGVKGCVLPTHQHAK